MRFFRDKGQRRSRRHTVAVPVLIRNGGSRIEALSINISDGGMYLFAAAHIPLGAQVEIEFRPPKRTQEVRTRGTVRRRALYLYAIEFLSDDPVTHDRTSAQTHPGSETY